MPFAALALRLGTAFGLHALIALGGGAVAPAPRPALGTFVALPMETRIPTTEFRN